MLYSITIIYWPYEKHMYFRIDQLQYTHKLQSVVYKVDYFVLETLLSSFMLLNTKVVFCSYLKS